ncbi:TPA: carbohydrate kinase [Escherichia coli]|nr:carbohydrate kinase [Escherichia coli]
MHRIDTKTAQKDKFGAGKNGFTRGNPQTGTPATDLDDDYFDMLQEELCSVVEASGASLEKGRHDQLLTALRALLLSRKNPFGDIKSDGTVKTALENLGLEGVTSLRSATFTSSTLWTAPAGVTEIELDGAGAGGGGGTGGPAAIGGGGGGAGETVVGRKITVVPGTTYTITIGLGGDGGTSVTSNGGDGGTTSFGTLLSLAGGKGGLKTGAAGVAGGTGGNDGLPGTFNVTPALSFGGAGGSGLLGAGGGAALLSSVGGNAGEFGGGGGGGAGNKSGGHGANGLIRIRW